MSGLTVGMTSLDHISLEIQAKENPEFKPKVDIIFSVIE